MRRSEINQIVSQAQGFLDEMKFLLPPFSQWSPETWKRQGPDCAEIVEAQLGWDITDFGSGDFSNVGLVLFTIRNGSISHDTAGRNKPYAEKILIVRENQVTPIHFHHHKMEDIVNRGGGKLEIQLWNSRPDGSLDDTAVKVSVDGRSVVLSAGSTIGLQPGESVCLPPRLYHKFWATAGAGTVLGGEVSRVNDDRIDNHFFEPVGRFPAIVEDADPRWLLTIDYPRYYGHYAGNP